MYKEYDHFTISKGGMTAYIFRSDGTLHVGPRGDWNLGQKSLDPNGSNVLIGDQFIQLGNWRLAMDNKHPFDLYLCWSGSTGKKTLMVWRKDG